MTDALTASKTCTDCHRAFEAPIQARHRLLCGDSTDPDDVRLVMDGKRATLCASDPPYNVDIDYGEESDDKKSAEAYEAFTRGWFALALEHSERQAITPGCSNLALWCRWFDPHFIAPWTKTNSMTRGRVSRFTCWEPVVFFGEHWKRERANDVFNFPVSAQTLPGGESLTPLHPCPKPLKMWEDLLDSYTEISDLIYEAFAGAGTTIIASERLGRRCVAMEIEPKYVDVCVIRFEQFTGTKALVIHRD